MAETDRKHSTTRTKRVTKPFRPNPRQIELVRTLADPTIKPTITAVCAEVGIARKTYYEWFDDPRFVTWFNDAWTQEMERAKSYLDNIGLKKALSDYRYWEAMQMMYGKFAKKADITTAGEKISAIDITNFQHKNDEELQRLATEQNRNEREGEG